MTTENRLLTFIALKNTIEYLERMKYASEHDEDFPMQHDINELQAAKNELDKVEELLKK